MFSLSKRLSLMFKFLISLLLILVISSQIITVNPVYSATNNQNLNQIKKTWKNLDKLFQQKYEYCQVEKTWLTDIGFRGLYCHIKSQLSYKKLQKIAKLQIFDVTQSPHTKSYLDLQSNIKFGHYNPQFVHWLNNKAIRSLTDDPLLIASTQFIYNKHIREQARIFYITYQILQQDTELLASEKEAYLTHLKNQTLPELYLQERFRTFSDKLEKKGYNWYIANVAPGFWVRRSIDGTDKEFFIALNRLILNYDPQFIGHIESN